jgi:peptide/histidine transporter 3/4
MILAVCFKKTYHTFWQVYVAAIRNRNLPLPEDPTELYEIEQDKEAAAEEIEFLPHRDIFRFK